MLKISKNQIVPGQQVVVNLEQKGKEAELAKEYFRGFKTGDILTVSKVTGGMVQFSHNGEEYSFFWSWFKSLTEIQKGDNLGSDKVEYVIFYKGKKYKAKKFGDMGKVKASLLMMMSYHDKFYNISRKFLNNCPELEHINTPEWLHGENLSRKDFEDVEIFEWSNRKLGNKVDFNAVDFYNEQMMLIKISSQFGTSCRELYKKVKDTHKYILVFMHEDYTKQYCDFDSLKESNIIKSLLQTSKFKNIAKVTKNGKTSIAFDNATDVIKLSNSIINNMYFIVDIMKGDQLAIKDQGLVIQEMRDEKLEALFG